jgi:TonB family protein
MTARRSGNLAEAKTLLLQARQQYEAAQATALTPVPKPQEQSDVAIETPADNEAPEPAPTMQPTPVRPEPTVIVQPTIAHRPEPPPVPSISPRTVEDDAFPIREKEFLQYVTRRVNPVLPPQARQAGIAGPVVVRVYLSPSGQLSKAEVVEGEMILREAALTALRQWSFRPFFLNRVPTTVRSVITINVQ